MYLSKTTVQQPAGCLLSRNRPSGMAGSFKLRRVPFLKASCRTPKRSPAAVDAVFSFCIQSVRLLHNLKLEVHLELFKAGRADPVLFIQSAVALLSIMFVMLTPEYSGVFFLNAVYHNGSYYKESPAHYG